MPLARQHTDVDSYVAASEPLGGFWGNSRAYAVSLLKSWWGDAARADNDWAFGYMPRVGDDHGTYRTVMDMVDGKVDGYFLLGQNPAVGSANARLQRLGMANLKWLVVRDLQMIESATFWKDGPEIETGELVTEDVGTEVFFLPAANHVEKDGTFTQTQRLLQWHHKAVEPPDDARSELWFYWQLGRILREKLAASTDERDRPLLDLTWDYPLEAGAFGPESDPLSAEPSADAVLREISGTRTMTGPDGAVDEALSSYTELEADGTTRSGCWIYCGAYADEVNQTARRKPGDEQDWVAAEWGWAWPANRRPLYNRASADPRGEALERAQEADLVGRGGRQRDGCGRRGVGRARRPRLRGDQAARPTGRRRARRARRHRRRRPVHHAERRQGVAVRADRRHRRSAAGALRAAESPVGNAALPRRHLQPGARSSSTARATAVIPSPHRTSTRSSSPPTGSPSTTPPAAMSRTLPYLAELQPEMFIEVSAELAARARAGAPAGGRRSSRRAAPSRRGCW